jgi:hypothetical protein
MHRSLVFLLIFAHSVAAAAADRAYVISWAYGSLLNRPVKSHTFATFFLIRDGQPVDKVDISWMPAPGYFAGFSDRDMPPFKEVPGHNYTLHETLMIATEQGRKLSRFGPYESRLELFELAQRMATRLASGQVEYKMLDPGFRPDAVNCIHAVTDIGGYVDTGMKYGDRASRSVIDHFARQGLLLANEVDEDLYLQLKDWLMQ